MVIPKVASDLKDNISKDSQLGGTLLFTYAFSDSLKVKFGLFYNREAFGNFFVPLAGIDWKATERLSFYGILPNNMRMEVKCSDKFYVGLGFKNYKRSYRLSMDFNNDFITVKETQAKFFVDFYTKVKIVLFADVAYMLKYDLAEHTDADPKGVPVNNLIYAPLNNNFLFTFGVAYRMRTN
jgi:hypothetical protein